MYCTYYCHYMIVFIIHELSQVFKLSVKRLKVQNQIANPFTIG